MAAKSRDQRRRRAPKKQPAKQRQSTAGVAKVRKRAAAPGVVEAALAVFAHEVRTPLTGILAISDLLATSELGERERRWADTIKAGAEHLASLATLFVDAAKNRETSRETNRKTNRKIDRNALAGLREDLFDLKALARSTGDSLAGRAAAKGLHAEIDISTALPSLVIGDRVRLRAALENLIDNAVKFTDAGGVAVSVAPVPGAKGRAKGGGKEGAKGRSKARTAVAFAVSDSGIGLTLAEVKRLFRPFSQANVSIASRYGGAGLGLSSVKQLARVMGGDIVVTPRRGGGTTFTLTVTLQTADAPEAVRARKGDGRAAAPGAPLRILGVEDNPFGRVVLNTILTELGHQAEFISRGEAAIERIEQGAFDAVLMDMVLPGIDGIEAIRRIRSLGQPLGRIAIIGVSGRGEDEAASRAAGADAFLLKPVSPRALATALLEATRRAAAAT